MTLLWKIIQADKGCNPQKKGQDSYHPLWQKAKGKPTIETAEFLYQCHGWKLPRRFVAIRILTDEGTDKGTFFPIPEYEFFCYVTNTPGSPWNIHKLYGKRATSENWIQWCKSQMASGTIRTQEFWANSAIFQSCIFAYNLMVWMMWLTTEEGLNEEPLKRFINGACRTFYDLSLIVKEHSLA